MSRNTRQSQTGVNAHDRGCIGVADSACFNPNPNLAWTRLRYLPFHDPKLTRCKDLYRFVCAFHSKLLCEAGCVSRHAPSRSGALIVCETVRSQIKSAMLNGETDWSHAGGIALMSRGDDTKQRIVTEAAGLFNQKGFEGGSISALMDATGLEKGGIYRHFSSKEEIAAEAFDYALNIATEARV